MQDLLVKWLLRVVTEFKNGIGGEGAGGGLEKKKEWHRISFVALEGRVGFQNTFGLGRSLGGGHENSLQYFCLEIPMDRRA